MNSRSVGLMRVTPLQTATETDVMTTGNSRDVVGKTRPTVSVSLVLLVFWFTIIRSVGAMSVWEEISRFNSSNLWKTAQKMTTFNLFTIYHHISHIYHTLLPATRHRWTCPALTSTRHAGTWSTLPQWDERLSWLYYCCYYYYYYYYYYTVVVVRTWCRGWRRRGSSRLWRVKILLQVVVVAAPHSVERTLQTSTVCPPGFPQHRTPLVTDDDVDRCK